MHSCEDAEMKKGDKTFVWKKPSDRTSYSNNFYASGGDLKYAVSASLV